MEAGLPHVSVIVPTYNRPERLRACLEALVALDYPRDRLEVIVVNDGGALPTRLPASGSEGPEVRIVTQPHRGAAAARNLAASHAAGTLLAFTDDDCRPSRDWLRVLAPACVAAGGAVVGGRTESDPSDGVVARTSQLIVDVVYRHYNGVAEDARLLASNNLAVGAAEFALAGRFDAGMTTAEDREFCDRWRCQGKSMRYVPGAVVRHRSRETLREFFLQHFGYGRGAYRVHAARRRRGQGRGYRELRFHLAVGNWLGYPLAAARPRERPLVALLLAVWQLANVSGYLCEALLALGGRVRGTGAVPAGREVLDDA